MNRRVPEYYKINCRITVDKYNQLQYFIDKGDFKSHYDIAQALISAYLLHLEGHIVSDILNGVFARLEPVKYGRLGWDVKRELKTIVCRIPINTKDYYEPTIQSRGFRTWYHLSVSLLGALLDKLLEDNDCKPATIEEEVATMFQELSDWLEPEYIKPKRACPSNSVYDDLRRTLTIIVPDDDDSDEYDELSDQEELNTQEDSESLQMAI